MSIPYIDQWLAAPWGGGDDTEGTHGSHVGDSYNSSSTIDAELIARIRSGDRAAFESLIVQYGRDLLVYLTAAVGTQDVAEDVLQELLIRLWNRHASLAPVRGFRPYLFAAARHAALDYHRATRRAQSALTRYARDGGAERAVIPDPVTALDDAQLRTALATAVEALPPRMREVWRLYRDQGLSYPEIADCLGVTVGTVKTQMSRAFTALRVAAAPFLTQR